MFWRITYRLGVNRMDGERDAGQRGEAAPQSGDGGADAREQRTGDGVQQHVGHVKPAGVAAEQRMVESVRRRDWKRRKGVCVSGLERPAGTTMVRLF